MKTNDDIGLEVLKRWTRNILWTKHWTKSLFLDKQKVTFWKMEIVGSLIIYVERMYNGICRPSIGLRAFAYYLG